MSERRPTRPAAHDTARRDWLVLVCALSLLAVLLGSGPAGSIGGQLPHVDALLFEVLGRIVGASPEAGPGLAGDAGAALAAAGLARLGGPGSAALSVVPVLGTMLALHRARPGRPCTVVVLLALLACLVLAAACLGLFSRWWAPAGTMAALLLAAPLWNWRRLAAATRVLAAEADTLRHAPDLLPPLARHQPAEAVARELQPLREAAARIRTLRRLLHALIDKLPHPAIVTNGAGAVLLSNRVARTAFASMPIEEQSIVPWLRVEFADHAGLDCLPPADGPGVHGVEAVDRNGRHWLADIDPARESALPLVYLIQFTDITPLRLAESARNASLERFGRELREATEPVLEALARAGERERRPEWANAVESHARRILALAGEAAGAPPRESARSGRHEARKEPRPE